MRKSSFACFHYIEFFIVFRVTLAVAPLVDLTSSNTNSVTAQLPLVHQTTTLINIDIYKKNSY